MKRVFITSTPDELEAYQAAAVDVVRELGHEPVLCDPAGRRGLDAVTACGRQACPTPTPTSWPDATTTSPSCGVCWSVR